MPASSSLIELLRSLDEPFTGEALFDQLPGSVFFLKDGQGRYLVVNETLVQRCGVRGKRDLLGRTAEEVFRPPYGQHFLEQDLSLLKSGKPLLGQLELHFYPSWDVGWCLTTKLPLRDHRKRVVGLVGVSQDLRLVDSEKTEYRDLALAVEFATNHLAQSLTVGSLAAEARMSRYQLDRRIRNVYGLTTGQWLLKLRIDAARQKLLESNDTIAAIAASTGYADQSAFTRQFRAATGLTPSEFRATCRQPREG